MVHHSFDLDASLALLAFLHPRLTYMKKNIRAVTTAFLFGATHNAYRSCSTDGRTVFSYKTPIAIRNDDLTEIILSSDKFSFTTTKQQNAIREIIQSIPSIRLVECSLNGPKLAIEYPHTQLSKSKIAEQVAESLNLPYKNIKSL